MPFACEYKGNTELTGEKGFQFVDA